MVGDRIKSALPAIALWSVLAIACGLPLAWLATQLISRPHLWVDAVPDAFRLRLIGRTFLYNGIAATLATLYAVPIAITLAFGGRWSRWLWWVLPVPLLVPSLVVTYGWKQAFGAAGFDPIPQSLGDISRCVFALSTWLWPVPTLAGAFAMSRLDANLLMQAKLDGATRRTIARLVAAPMLLGWLAAMLLALQEFAVFEPTGISVIATEVRIVFETGASLDASWSLPSARLHAGDPLMLQNAKMGAALAVMLPSLLATLAIVLAGMRIIRSLDAGAGEWGDASTRTTRLPAWTSLLAVALVFLLLGTPGLAMATTRHTTFKPLHILFEFQPQLVGSISLGLIAGAVGALCVALASIIRPSRKMVGLALASFLIGGQWAAIALISCFSREHPWWLVYIYDSYTMPVLAYLGRFGWLGLIAAAATWSAGVRPLRELAWVDGAGRFATWRSVILPIAWPLLLGAALLVFTLSMTEVPATTLLQPANTLVPMLMTWAHMLNYDAMIDASLMITMLVMAIGASVVGLVRLSIRMTKHQ